MWLSTPASSARCVASLRRDGVPNGPFLVQCTGQSHAAARIVSAEAGEAFSARVRLRIDLAVVRAQRASAPGGLMLSSMTGRSGTPLPAASTLSISKTGFWVVLRHISPLKFAPTLDTRVLAVLYGA